MLNTERMYDTYTYVESSTYRQGKSSQANRLVANIALSDKYLKHQYYENVRCRLCCRPTLKANKPGSFPFLIFTLVTSITTFYILTMIEAKQITLNSNNNSTFTTSLDQSLNNSLLIFKGGLRKQAWRYLSYVLVQSNIAQTTIYLVLLLVLGIPLELVHGSMRLIILFLISVGAGALFSFILDHNCWLLGCGSGIYALVFAWISNMILNVDTMSMSSSLYRLFPVCLLIVFDMLITGLIYYQHTPWFASWCKGILEALAAPSLQISPFGQMTGAFVGITIGTGVFKNFRESICDSVSQKAIFIFWGLLLTGAVICQIVPISLNCHGGIELFSWEIMKQSSPECIFTT